MVDNNYIVHRLRDGKNVKIVFMSHNAYWTQLLKLDDIYENCSVDVFGGGTEYIRTSCLSNHVLDDCDFIILYSLDFYSSDELDYMKQIASKISSEKNKRVSIGYSYVIPIEQRTNRNICDEIKLVSIKDGNEYETTNYAPTYFNSPMQLVNMVVKTHDDLEMQKQKIKEL